MRNAIGLGHIYMEETKTTLKRGALLSCRVHVLLLNIIVKTSHKLIHNKAYTLCDFYLLSMRSVTPVWKHLRRRSLWTWDI